MGSFELRNIHIIKSIKSPFFWLCCLFALTAKGHLEIIDTEYSLRTAKAILENGTMLIEPVCDETRKISPIIDGTDKIYSQYGIGLVAIFIPIVFISKFFCVLLGIDELMLSHFLLSFYNIPFALLGLWFFRSILRSQGQDERLATFLMICVGLGTAFWKYVVTDFSEITQIALLLGAIRSYTLTNDSFRWIKVFSFLSLLILLKILYVIILPPFVILAFKDGLKNKRIILNCMHGLLCLIPAAAFLMYLNWLRFDSIFQSGYGKQQTAFSLSYLERDWFDYIFSFDRGIIPYSPLLLMVPFLVKDFYIKNKSLLFLILSISFILYITTASWIGWKGGYCWGNRNIVTIVPLLTIAFAFIKWEKPLIRKMMALLLLISIPIQIIGVSLKTHEWSTIVTKLTLITEQSQIPNELSGSALLFKEKLNNSSGLYKSEDFVHVRENVIDLTSYESFNGYNFWLIHASKLFSTKYIHFISLLMLIVIIFLCLNIFKRFYVSHEKIYMKIKE